MKQTFIFRTEWLDYMTSINLTPDEVVTILQAIADYVTKEIAPDFNGDRVLLAVWLIIQHTLDQDLKTYNARVEGGKLGGRPRKLPDFKTEPDTDGEACETSDVGSTTVGAKDADNTSTDVATAPATTTKRVQYPQEFDTIWKAYDQTRGSKKKAYDQYQRRLKEGYVYGEISDAVARFIAQRDKQYRPALERFLGPGLEFTQYMYGSDGDDFEPIDTDDAVDDGPQYTPTFVKLLTEHPWLCDGRETPDHFWDEYCNTMGLYVIDEAGFLQAVEDYEADPDRVEMSGLDFVRRGYEKYAGVSYYGCC